MIHWIQTLWFKIKHRRMLKSQREQDPYIY